MSSDLSAPAGAGRCLFCNLGCAHELEPVGVNGWRPRYGGEAADPLCPRGQMLADLLQQPARLQRPALRDGPLPLAAAVSRLAGMLGTGDDDGEPMPLTVWLDGNMAVEDILEAHAFCAAYRGRTRILLHLPPHELGAAEGLDAAGVSPVGPAEWEQADAFLCLGDPLSSHPPVARHLLRRGKQRSATPLVVMDAGAGYLSTASKDFFLVRPGAETLLLESLVAAQADGSGRSFPPELELDAGDEERIRQAAQRLRAAKRPAVVIAPQNGSRAGWRAVTERAARWAAERGGTVTLLTGHANALAAARLGRRLGIADWHSGIEAEAGDNGVLLVAGWDPSSAYPRAAWAPSAQRACHVVLATTFPPAERDWVDISLPLALGAEAGGGYLLADGRLRHLDPLVAPPAGIVTLREMLARLAAELGLGLPAAEQTDLLGAAPLPGPAADAPVPAVGGAGNGQTLAVLGAASAHYFDGHITGHSQWTARVQALPELLVGPADAQALGLAGAGVACLSNEQGSALVRVRVAHQQPSHAGCFAEVCVSPHLRGWLLIRGAGAAVRRLAAWPAGSGQPGTLHVQAAPVAEAGTRKPMGAARPTSLAEAAHGD